MKVVYCGGCNPHIDRRRLIEALEHEPALAGKTIFVSGCPRACASGHEHVAEARDTFVVAGEHLDAEPTPAAKLAGAIKRKAEGAVDGLEV
jgi:hypothetical protein